MVELSKILLDWVYQILETIYGWYICFVKAGIV